MKRDLTIIALLFCLAGLCGGCRQRAEAQNRETPAAAVVTDYAAAYESVISLYKDAYPDGHTYGEYACQIGLSEYISSAAHVGYALRDLDGDGTPELLIAAMGEGDMSGGVLFEIDTLTDGVPVQLACSSARNRWYLCKDNTLLNEGSGGAGHSAFVLNRVEGDRLIPTEAVITFFDNSPADGFYHQAGGCSYEPRPEDTALEEQVFHSYVTAWERERLVPPLKEII